MNLLGQQERREMDILFAAIDEYVKRGGRMVFWTCSNGCRDFVDWQHEGEKFVATCRKCGRSNARPHGSQEKGTV